MKRSYRASQPAAQLTRADGRSASCILGTKVARGGQLKDRADQQMALEHSSEKSCQEHVAQGATGSLRGRAQKTAPMDGTSSQGSEASHSQEWQENGEETWQSATHRCAVCMTSSTMSSNMLRLHCIHSISPTCCSGEDMNPGLHAVHATCSADSSVLLSPGIKALTWQVLPLQPGGQQQAGPHKPGGACESRGGGRVERGAGRHAQCGIHQARAIQRSGNG